MEKNKLSIYVGMAVHFVYYHHAHLHQEKTFPDDYWQHLLHISNTAYLTNMMHALEYALTTEDYCLNTIKSPHLNRYPIEDIKLFFEKFYEYLKENLENKLIDNKNYEYKNNLNETQLIIDWLEPLIVQFKVSTKIKITSLLLELHQITASHVKFEGIINNNNFTFRLSAENDKKLNNLLKKVSAIRNSYSTGEIKDKRIALMTCGDGEELVYYKIAYILNNLQAELNLHKNEIRIDLV